MENKPNYCPYCASSNIEFKYIWLKDWEKHDSGRNNFICFDCGSLFRLKKQDAHRMFNANSDRYQGSAEE